MLEEKSNHKTKLKYTNTINTVKISYSYMCIQHAHTYTVTCVYNITHTEAC